MSDHTPQIPQSQSLLRYYRRQTKNQSIDAIARRFWSKADRSCPDGCWMWHGAYDSDTGYGHFTIGSGHALRTHRVAYELTYGPIPDGMCVCHTCDNRLCVNPDHLFLGTIQDNLGDMYTKRRHSHGSEHYQAKLTDSDVIEIRRQYREEHCSTSELAKRYGVSRQAVYHVVTHRTWRHIPEP